MAFDVEAQVRSGTRLKQQWHQYDGTRAPVAVFDHRRAERCSSRQIDADPQRRCVPATTATNAVFGDVR